MRILAFLLATACGAVFAAAPRVVINEIMYHPTDAEGAAEFIELFNAENRAADLSGWRFTRGIEYVFAEGTILEAQGYLVLCRDAAAFAAAYGAGIPPAGVYARGLSNSGERITLVDAGGAAVQDIDYLDEPPWPPEADGGGASLELIAADLDTDDPYSWRASVGGPTPGRQNSVAGLKRPVSMAGARHFPEQPAPRETVEVQVRVNHIAPLRGVTLNYEFLGRNDNAAVTGQVAMRDDGVAPDAVAGDDIWTCRLSGRQAMTLVRYFFTAEDVESRAARFPEAEAATPNRAYFVAEPISSSLGVWWLVMTPQAYTALQSHVFTDDLEPAAFVSDTGKVYDRIGVRYRGARARYANKKSWKLVFNGDRLFRGRKRLNLNAEVFDPALIREKLAYEMFEDLGALWLETELVRVQFTRDTGALSPFLGLFTAVEHAGSRWVRRMGRDDAAVYKSFSRSNQGDERYASSAAAYLEHYDKETRKDEPWDDFIGMTRDVNALFRAPEAAIQAYFEERVNLETFYGYMTANACMQNWDQFNKNHYMLLDVEGSGLWEMAPWDVDRVLGDHWDGSFTYYTLSPYLGRQADPGITGWNRVMDRFLAVTAFREEYMRRLKSALQTRFLEARWWPRIDELAALAEATADLDNQKWGGNWRNAIVDVKSFITNRRMWLLQTYFPGVPPAAPANLTPADGTVVPQLPFTLRASPFAHEEPDVLHASSHWQIVRDGDPWERAVVDVVSATALESLVVSQSTFEAPAVYRWRVAYSGTNAGVSGWSAPTAFTLADLGYIAAPVDLGPYFTHDVVVNAGDRSNSPFDAGDCSLIEDGYQDGVGLPPDGQVGGFLLGDYNDLNSIQLGMHSPPVSIELPPGRYLGLDFPAGCGNGDADIHLDVRYEDGGVEAAILRSDDWYNDRPADGVGGALRDGLMAAIDDMDRVCGDNMQYSRDPGLFIWHVELDPRRTAVRLELDPGGARSWYSANNTLCNVMALTTAALSATGFVRGDANEDGRVDLSDAVAILAYLFRGAASPPCVDRLDVNDSGKIDVADSVYLLGYLFTGGPPPPPPFPDAGPDPTPDDLECLP